MRNLALRIRILLPAILFSCMSEEVFDPCEVITCSDHGVCVTAKDERPRCVCDDGYEESSLQCVRCGDGACNLDETPSSCPRDCPSVCGDGSCTHDEASGPCGTCPSDCSGPGGWVAICGGSFVMGSASDEIGRSGNEIEHEVVLTRGFMIQTTEVTQSEFDFISSRLSNPSTFFGCSDCPVDNVNWNEAVFYANAISERDGLERCYDCTERDETIECALDFSWNSPYECPGYRLPTEAEWEYAARANTSRSPIGLKSL